MSGKRKTFIFIQDNFIIFVAYIFRLWNTYIF